MRLCIENDFSARGTEQFGRALTVPNMFQLTPGKLSALELYENPFHASTILKTMATAWAEGVTRLVE